MRCHGLSLSAALISRYCRCAWDQIKRLLERDGATVENIDKAVSYMTDGANAKQRGSRAIQPPGTVLVVTALV